MEFLYCVTSQHWQDCKLGCWQGSFEDLWSRYATTLGSDVMSIVVFQCQGRRVLEQMLFGYTRKLHVCGEVYNAAAADLFMEFCNVMCMDSVFSTDMVIRNTMYTEKQLRKQDKQMADIENQAKRAWKRVCADISDMQRKFDSKNKSSQQQMDKCKSVDSFIEACLEHTDKVEHFVERSVLY